MGLKRCIMMILFLGLIGAGCSKYGPYSMYMTPKIDQQTGFYVTESSVMPEDIKKRDTRVDIGKFRFVYLQTATDLFPGRFEFYVRAALARFGLKQVVNRTELAELVGSDPKLSSLKIATNSDQQKLSALIGPILRIQLYSYENDRGYRYGKLSVMDLSTGNSLLEILFARRNRMGLEADAYYPLFNELRKWISECSPDKGGSAL